MFMITMWKIQRFGEERRGKREGEKRDRDRDR